MVQVSMKQSCAPVSTILPEIIAQGTLTAKCLSTDRQPNHANRDFRFRSAQSLTMDQGRKTPIITRREIEPD